MKRFFRIIKKILPWVVAALIFVYLFYEYRPGQLWKAVEHVNIPFFLSLSLIYFIILYVVDCYAMSSALTRFGYPVGVKGLFPARGVTYLIMNINYPASQAAFAYYLKRTKKVPIFEVLGIFFFIAIIDLYFLMSLAFVGSFFQDAVIRGVDIAAFVRTFVLVAYIIFVLQLVFWRRWFSRITGIKKKIRFIEWFRSRKIFCVFNEASVKDYLKIALLRSPIHISIVLFLFVAMRAFGAYIPLVTVLGNVPIAFLIGTIPITPGGLGTTNVALIELIYSHVSGPIITEGVVTPKELILAVTLLWMFTNYALKALVGVGWLQRVSKQLFEPTDKAKAQEVVSEATHLMGEF